MDWSQLGEIALRALLIYTALLVMLRLADRRDLAQMTPMDMLLLLLLSEAVSPALTGGDDSVAGGLVAAAVLLVCAVALRWMAHYSRRAEVALEGRELVLIRDGRVRQDVLRDQRMTDQELRTVLHEHGLQRVDQVAVAFIEPSGDITVIEK